jgi:hypothetical protein
VFSDFWRNKSYYIKAAIWAKQQEEKQPDTLIKIPLIKVKYMICDKDKEISEQQKEYTYRIKDQHEELNLIENLNSDYFVHLFILNNFLNKCSSQILKKYVDIIQLIRDRALYKLGFWRKLNNQSHNYKKIIFNVSISNLKHISNGIINEKQINIIIKFEEMIQNEIWSPQKFDDPIQDNYYLISQDIRNMHTFLINLTQQKIQDNYCAKHLQQLRATNNIPLENKLKQQSLDLANDLVNVIDKQYLTSTNQLICTSDLIDNQLKTNQSTNNSTIYLLILPCLFIAICVCYMI